MEAGGEGWMRGRRMLEVPTDTRDKTTGLTQSSIYSGINYEEPHPSGASVM